MQLGGLQQSGLLQNTANANWSLVPVRTRVRYHFPRPSEYKRIKRSGWVCRITTPGGRKIIMRRLLKGCFKLTH